MYVGYIATINTRLFNEGRPLQSRVTVIDGAGSIVEYRWRVLGSPEEWLLDHGWIVQPGFEGKTARAVTPLRQPTAKARGYIAVANRLSDQVDDLYHSVNNGCGVTGTWSDLKPGGEFRPGGYLQRLQGAREAAYDRIAALEEVRRELLLEVGILPHLYYLYHEGYAEIEELLAPRRLVAK